MEQNKKQTAIQELIDDLDYELKSRGMIVNWDMYLQKEKEQIMEACGAGFNDGQAYMDGKPKFQSAEQYYNQTYTQ